MSTRMSIPLETDTRFPALPVSSQIRRFARLFFRNLWRSGVMPLLPLVIAIGVWYSRLLIGEGVVLWNEVSISVAMTYAIVGPLCAALAAWVAGRPYRRKLGDQLESTSLPGWQQNLLAFATAAGIGTIGYGCMVLVMTGWTATQATWGSPYGVVLFSGLPMVILFCLVGAAVGMLWPHHLASLLVLAITGGSVIMGNTIQNRGVEANARELTLWNTLLSLRDGFSPWEARRSAPELFENMLMATGMCALIVALVLVIRPRGPVAIGALALSMVWASAGVAMTATGERRSWMAPETTASFEYACSDSGSVDVCLHPAWSSAQPFVAEIATQIYTPIRGLEGVPTEIIQVPSYNRSEDAEGTFSMPGGRMMEVSMSFHLVSTVFPDLNRNPGAMSDAELIIAGWLQEDAGGRAMLFIPRGPDGHASGRASEKELRGAIDRFSSLSPDQQRAWLVENWDALRAGELTLEDLP